MSGPTERRSAARLVILALSASVLTLGACGPASDPQQINSGQSTLDVQPPPAVGATCTAARDKLTPCWTAPSHLELILEVTEKNKENPTYTVIDEQGKTVGSGRLKDGSNPIELQPENTFLLAGPWAGRNTVRVEIIATGEE